MTARRATILLLIVLLGIGSVQLATIGTDSPAHTILWTSVLFGLPVLIACVLTRQRWALMGAVMYGTIGLALDISTVVQGLTKPDVPQMVATLSGITGTLNFLVIIFGGKEFLTIGEPSSPPESPRPSPPSPSSS